MNQTARLLFGVCAAASVLAACGGSSEAPAPVPAPITAPAPAPAPAPTPVPITPPPRAAVTPADFFARPSSPAMVASTLDDARAARGTIGRAGGTLSATGADGAKYTLVVPSGALADDVEITLTPIAATTGAPWTRATGARFAPAGLQFFQYATLAIEPASDIPLDRQVMMGASAEGELFVAMPDIASRAPRIKVLHFTDYWYADMTPEQLNAQRLRIPTAAALQIENEVNAVLNNLRQRMLLGATDDDASTPSFTDLLDNATRQWWELVLKPRIAAARTCQDWKAAIAAVLSVERQRQLLGAGEGSIPVLGNASGTDFWGVAGSGAWIRANVPFGGNLMRAGVFQCAKDSSERCTTRHLFDLVETALGWERQKQLLGIEDDVAFESTYVKFDQRLDACHRVRVELDSAVTIFGTPGAREATTTVSSRIDHRIFPGGLTDVFAYASRGFAGDAGIPITAAALQNSDLAITGPSCGTVSNVTRGGGSLRLDFSFGPARSLRPQFGRLKLRLGDTTESWTVTGCGQGSVRYGPKPLWTDAFLSLHQAESFERPGVERGVDLQFSGAELPLNGGEVLVQKQWQRTVGGLGETTTLRVVHTPQPIDEPPLPAPQ
jgi:hypothetical protein